MKVKIFALVLVTSLVVGGVAGVTTAHSDDSDTVGASTNCDKDQEKGDHSTVEDDPDGMASDIIRYFGNGGFFEDNPCDGKEGDDYGQAHANAGGTGAQVCYSDHEEERPNVNSGENYDNGYCK